MQPELAGIERRLDELNERLARLEPLKARPRAEFDADAYLRDIVERNLEIAAQCCIDISHRIISLEKARKPRDYYEAIVQMGELGILTPEFARSIAPIAGLRNVLIHGYVRIDWDRVYRSLQQIDDLARFADSVSRWLRTKARS